MTHPIFREIIDLASGGGGGWIKLGEHIADEIPDVKVRLTDYYPNISAFNHTVKKRPELFSHEEESLNALDVPIFVWWDGLVSVLRTYSEKELKGLVDSLDNKDAFVWEISFVKNGTIKIYYLLGVPKV